MRRTQKQTLRRDSRELTTCSVTLRVESIDEEARTVEAVLATDHRSTVFDMDAWQKVDEILVMRGADLPGQIVMVDSHPQLDGRVTIEDVRGSVRSLRIKGNKLLGVLHFADDPRSEEAWQKVRNGHVTDVSPGIHPIDKVRIGPNESKRVDGKLYRAGALPLYITRRWEPRELSLVPAGADPAAKIREDQTNNSTLQEEETVNEKLRAYLESIGLRAEADEPACWTFFKELAGDRLAEAERLRTATPPADKSTNPPIEPPVNTRAADTPPPANQSATPPVDPETIRTAVTEGITAERQRVTRLRELAGEDVPADLRTRAEVEGWDEARASREFLAAVREARPPAVSAGGAAIHVRGHELDATVRALGAGMMLREGLDPVADYREYRDGNLVRRREGQNTDDLEQAADRGYQYRDMSLLDVCREAIRLDGGTVPTTRGEIIRAAVSGSTLTNIFTTSISAQLLSGYTDAADSTVGWCSEADVPNFQTNERAMMGKFGDLKKLARGDTAKHLNVSDSKEEYKIARYAGQFVVDEQDIIDDRLGAVNQVAPQDIGQTAAQLRPNLVYSILLANAALSDTGALFNATAITTAGGHANLTTAAMAAAALQAGIVAMSKLRIEERPINVRPRYLIVPQDLRFTAAILLKSAERIISSASGGTYNPLQNEGIELRFDDRIGVGGVTDPATGTAHVGTATNWFLAARPGESGAKIIEVGFLRGTGRAPQLRSFVLTQGQWGLGWDIKHDIGAKALDYRGLHKSTGAG